MGAGSGFNQSAAPASSGLTWLGLWNASTNTPTIVSGVGNNGDYYIVDVAGTTTIDGISEWEVGDWIIFSSAAGKWQKIDNSDTSNATVNTTNATITTLQTIAIASGTGVVIETDVVYRKTGGSGTGTTGDSGTFKLIVGAKNVGGTVTLTGPVQNSYTSALIDAEDVTMSVSGTNVLIRVTGILNDNITWNSYTKVKTV